VGRCLAFGAEEDPWETLEEISHRERGGEELLVRRAWSCLS
jgi:hypothetical protein